MSVILHRTRKSGVYEGADEGQWFRATRTLPPDYCDACGREQCVRDGWSVSEIDKQGGRDIALGGVACSLGCAAGLLGCTDSDDFCPVEVAVYVGVVEELAS